MPLSTDPAHDLRSFLYTHDFEHGSLEIHLMGDKDLEYVVDLLKESFIDSMWIPRRHANLVEYCVRHYFLERSYLVPHVATLVGFYKKKGGEGGEVFAGTVDLSFDEAGAGGMPLTPEPPRECPYVSNMAVKKELRRKGIGWHLLKASEELVTKMSDSQTIYLHCRVSDKGPFALYVKAGYHVCETDSKLLWLTFQRRRHLMRKDLSLGASPGTNHPSKL